MSTPQELQKALDRARTAEAKLYRVREYANELMYHGVLATDYGTGQHLLEILDGAS